MAAIADNRFPTSAEHSFGDQGPSGQGTIPTPTDVTAGQSNPTGNDTTPAKSSDMLDRVVQGAHETIDRLAETAAPHVLRLQEGVSARAEHVKEVGDEWAESLRCTVRENPLAAVAAALAVGVLVARLIQR